MKRLEAVCFSPFHSCNYGAFSDICTSRTSFLLRHVNMFCK